MPEARLQADSTLIHLVCRGCLDADPCLHAEH